MKKTFNDVLADIEKNLIGKTLHGISGTASAFTIVEVDYQNNNVVLDVQGKRKTWTFERLEKVWKEMYYRPAANVEVVFGGSGSSRNQVETIYANLGYVEWLYVKSKKCIAYTNSEDIIEVNGEGEILWGKTIDESFAMIEDNRPYYMELYTEKSVEDDMDYFKRLHECVLTECSRQLRDAQLDALFDMDVIELSEETLADFGDKEYVLERIIKELNLQFNTHRQILLKTLYAYVSQDRRMLDENDGISMFGTTAYHAVWEKACAEVFDNKLNTTLAQLKMTVPLADKYNSKTAKRQKLIDIIEKPIWQGEDTEAKAADTLIPDLISIPCIDGKDWFIIFDAKYYNLQLEKGKSLRGNPGVGDVTKQYLYQLAYKDFINAHGIAEVRNCFLMPTEKKDIVKKGCARMAMLEALNLKNIQIRLIPAAELYDNYLTGNHMDITRLEL